MIAKKGGLDPKRFFLKIEGDIHFLEILKLSASTIETIYNLKYKMVNPKDETAAIGHFLANICF